jgi:hypothetical protein
MVGEHEVLESVFVEMDPVLHGVRRITRRWIPLLRGEGFGRTKIETTERRDTQQRPLGRNLANKWWLSVTLGAA